MDAVFQTIMDSSFASYTIGGMKALAVLFFLINILKQNLKVSTTKNEDSVPTAINKCLTGWVTLGVGVPYGKCIVGPVGCRGAACRNKLRTCVYP